MEKTTRKPVVAEPREEPRKLRLGKAILKDLAPQADAGRHVKGGLTVIVVPPKATKGC